MFHYIKGRVTMRFEGGVVIEAAGIGYELHVPDNSPAYLAAANEEMLLYTEMVLREDEISIYGFTDKESLETFKKLTTVNGVGAKAALSLLSAMTLSELTKAIIYEDALMLTRAQGIGKKIAQRIVLELKDKLRGLGSGLDTNQDLKAGSNEKDEAIIGLMTLGYSRSEAAEAINLVGLEAPSTEALMKEALRSLMRR